MDWLTNTYHIGHISGWQAALENYLFIASLAFLGFELARYGWQKRFSWQLAGDTLTNFITLAAFFAITFLIAAVYVSAFYLVYESMSLWQLPINGWTVIAAIVLADLAYYWEHRFTHRVGIAWSSHTVHHSSPHFNISVAYRFGPLDWLWPLPFHLPLAMLGFHPFLILFAEALVQLYQTLLHTEAIGKLPKPVERVMNTPSHHRVHHGANPEYLDKNYGGIFIVWDRLFGTFAEERAPVQYGLVTPIESINPITVFFHGFTRLARKIWRSERVGNALGYLIRPPDWSPRAGERSIR